MEKYRKFVCYWAHVPPAVPDIPAFCDVVVMVDGNASMYLGSPQLPEMVTGEKVSLEEMGGAKMHTSVSGCADALVSNEDEAIDFAKRYFAYMPANATQLPPRAPTSSPERPPAPLSKSFCPMKQSRLI